MNKRERIEYGIGKADIAVGRMVYGIYLAIAVSSTTAIAVSLPSAILEILPKWMNIALPALGAMNLPGSFHAIPKMRDWLRDADKTMKTFEEKHGINLPTDRQNN